MLPQVKMRELESSNTPDKAIIGDQKVTFESNSINVPVFNRDLLCANNQIIGPAIITQLDSTSLILPGQIVEVEKFGSLIVRESGV
jgi:N-methylhydantoinase A